MFVLLDHSLAFLIVFFIWFYDADILYDYCVVVTLVVDSKDISFLLHYV